MDGIIAYVLSKKFTKDTVIGMGAIKGAPCQVQSIDKVDKTTTITLKWEDNVGGVHTQAFDVEDGEDGISVVDATITANGHLELTLSDGNDIDCGKILPQYDTMPPADATTLGAIYQYIGATDVSYTNGYFYECVYEGGSYKWVKKLVQDSYTKIEIGDLTQLPDNTKNVVENIVDINDKIDDKENIFRYNVIPTADVSISGAIIQYLGSTNSTYTNGYYYQCVESPVGSGTYVWVQKNVQPNNGGGGGDGVVDGYYNSADQLFYEDSAFLNPITGEDNTIYVDLNTNGLYRYDGTIFIKVSSSTDSYTKAEIGDLSDLPDTSKNVIENIDLLSDDISLLNGSILTIKTDITQLQGSLANKVDKITGKGLSTNDYTNDDKEKLVNLSPIYLIGSGLNLNSITGELTASGIDVPIDSELSDTSINPVQNKVITTKIEQLEASKLSLSDVDNALSGSSINPVQNQVITLAIDQLQGSVLNKIQKMLGAQVDNFTVIDNNGGVKDSGISKDVVPITVSASNKLLVASDLSVKADKVSGATDNDIALLDNTGNLKDSNKKLSDYQEKLTDGNGINIDASNNISLDITYLTASRVGYIPATEKGSNNGVAELDNAGKVPSSQLPSYVDDVIEGYLDSGTFYEDSAHTIPITPEDGKIYVNLADNTTYRWGGTAYVQISSSLALGTTHTTAYYGDLGQTAYNHSQITNGSNPHNTTADNVNLKVPIPALSGSKLDVESTLYGINTELGKKADKVASAISGHLAGLDGNGNLTDSGVVASNVIEKVTTATGLLKDDGTVDTTSYAPSANAYLVGDTVETTIDDTDYFPFYDTSATGKRKTLFSSIVNKLKNTFATLVTGTFTAGNLVSLDSSGNIADSGKKASDFATPTDVQDRIRETVGWTGRNLYNKETGKANTVVTQNGESTSSAYYNFNASDYIEVEPNTSYYLQDGCGNTTQNTCCVYDNSKTFLRYVQLSGSGAQSGIINTGNNAKYIRLNILASYTNTCMLSKGSDTNVPYEAYHNDVDTILATKIDKVSTATQNDIAVFDANGGVADSNVSIINAKVEANGTSGSHINLNDYKTAGTYFWNPLDVTTTDNAPSGINQSNSLLVVSLRGVSTGSVVELTQTFYHRNSQGIYVRYCYSSNNWTTWKKLSYSNEVATIAPTPASGLTESDIVDAVNSATATNANAPSLYGVQKYSNEKTVRRVLNGANIPSGTSMTATGIGTWTDKAIDQITSADEADWWYDSAFVVPVYYMLTSDTSIVTGKTYYTRSGTAPNYTYTVVASPVVADIGTYYEQYSDDVDISIKFDPSGDTATLGGYIFDSTTGKICIKFGNNITVATARIAVDITYTRNEVG